MNSNEVRRIIMKRMIVSPVIFASMFVVWAVPKAQARDCSNASLQGGYGFTAGVIYAPARTPRAVVGRYSFDGKGGVDISVTINDNGTVTHPNVHGTYTVNADCTGKIFTGGTSQLEIVLVDGGKEFYQIRTDPSTLVSLFNAAKKQFPDDNDDNQER